LITKYPNDTDKIKLSINMVYSMTKKKKKYLPTVDKSDVEVSFINIDFSHRRHLEIIRHLVALNL